MGPTILLLLSLVTFGYALYFFTYGENENLGWVFVLALIAFLVLTGVSMTSREPDAARASCKKSNGVPLTDSSGKIICLDKSIVIEMKKAN